MADVSESSGIPEPTCRGLRHSRNLSGSELPLAEAMAQAVTKRRRCATEAERRAEAVAQLYDLYVHIGPRGTRWIHQEERDRELQRALFVKGVSGFSAGYLSGVCISLR